MTRVFVRMEILRRPLRDITTITHLLVIHATILVDRTDSLPNNPLRQHLAQAVRLTFGGTQSAKTAGVAEWEDWLPNLSDVS